MFALINGSNGLVKLAKGSDETLKLLIAADDGATLDITGDTVDLLVYERTDRANAAIATHAVVGLTTPTVGHATATLADSELTYGPGVYYMFIRHTDTSASKVYLSEPFTVEVF